MKMQESDYVSFQRACVMLAEKLMATKEEVALWAWLGKRCGGIDAYSSPRPSICSKATGCDDFKPEHCGSFAPSPQFAHIPGDLEESATPWGWVADAYFLRREVESFNPSKVGRYISWGELIARWGAYGLTESDVLSKVRGRIHDDELTDMAPLFGGTEVGGKTGAPVSWAMFPLADIEAIEVRDFHGTADTTVKVGAGTTSASILPTGIPTGAIIERFKLTDAWADKLKHITRNPFLRPALMCEGCRKSGKTPATPHRWNPVVLAEILIERDGRNRRAMEAVITHHFPEWQDAWFESMASDEVDEYAA